MGDFREQFGPNVGTWTRDARNITLTPEVKAALIDSRKTASARHSRR
jgi:hypothetical protein